MIYQLLRKHSFPNIPKLLAHNNDRSGFALEALSSVDGWDWSDKRNYGRLADTIVAMDTLADIKIQVNDEKNYFKIDDYSYGYDGWGAIMKSSGKLDALLSELRKKDYKNIVETLDAKVLSEASAQYVPQKQSFVHYDVQGNNCAWNSRLRTVKLIDWSWACIGDRKLDINAMLVCVYVSGLDITWDDYKDRLPIFRTKLPKKPFLTVLTD